MSATLTLPYSFDSSKYVRPALYVVTICPLLALAGNSYEALLAEFSVTTWLRLIFSIAIGMALCIAIVHYLLRYMGCAKGILSRGYVMIEPLRIFELDGGRKGGNFPLSDFSHLRLIHPGKKKRKIKLDEDSSAHILQLRAKADFEHDIVLLFSRKQQATQLAEQLAQALDMPLEVKS